MYSYTRSIRNLQISSVGCVHCRLCRQCRLAVPTVYKDYDPDRANTHVKYQGLSFILLCEYIILEQTLHILSCDA